MKRILFAAILATTTAASYAAPIVVAAEGDLNGVDTNYTTVPPVSSTDDLQGLVATGIEVSYTGWNSGNPAIWPSHNGIPGVDFLQYSKFTDGIHNNDYPGQLPSDYYPDGSPGPVDQPPAKMFFDIRGTGGASAGAPVDLMQLIVYAKTGDADSRAAAIVDVYTTTDNPPTAGGAWTVLGKYFHPDAVPLNWAFETDNPGVRSTGIVIEDEYAGPMAVNITGLRLDFHANGFGNQLRDPAVDDGAGKSRNVGSTVLAEFDATTVPGGTSVNDWSLF